MTWLELVCTTLLVALDVTVSDRHSHWNDRSCKSYIQGVTMS